MTTVNPTVLSTINDRLPSINNEKVLNQFTYGGKTERVSTKPIYGLAQLMIAERNYITGDKHHPHGDAFYERAGFFGTSNMRIYLMNVVELFALIETGEAIYTGKVNVSGNDLSILNFAQEVVNNPSVITFNEQNTKLTERQLASQKRTFDFRKQRIQWTIDTPMTSENFECLRAYAEDYREFAVGYLSELLQMSRGDVWSNFGELVAIEAETRNLVLRINGGYLRQQPRLVFEAA